MSGTDEAERLRYGALRRRATRVRRIAKGVAAVGAIVTLVVFLGMVWVLPERWAWLAGVGILGVFAWIVPDRTADRLAERIEGWLSSPP